MYFFMTRRSIFADYLSWVSKSHSKDLFEKIFPFFIQEIEMYSKATDSQDFNNSKKRKREDLPLKGNFKWV